MNGYALPDCDGHVVSLKKGQLVTMETADGAGFVRQPAPDDGILLELKSESLFIPAANLRSALRGTPTRTAGVQMRLARKGDCVVLETKGVISRESLAKEGLLIGTRRSSLLIPTSKAQELLADLDAPTKAAGGGRPAKALDELGR